MAPAGTGSPPQTPAQLPGSDFFLVDPFSFKTDQHQVSPCIIYGLLNRVVMRIEDMISEDKSYYTSTTSSHYIHRKPMGETNENLSFDIRV